MFWVTHRKIKRYRKIKARMLGFLGSVLEEIGSIIITILIKPEGFYSDSDMEKFEFSNKNIS